MGLALLNDVWRRLPWIVRSEAMRWLTVGEEEDRGAYGLRGREAPWYLHGEGSGRGQGCLQGPGGTCMVGSRGRCLMT